MPAQDSHWNSGVLRHRRLSPAWLTFPLAFVIAMRGDTRDTAYYVDVFRDTGELTLDPFQYYAEFGVEWGFGLASWLFAGLGLGPRALFFAVSLGTFYFIGRTARSLGLGFYEVMPYYLGTFFLTQQPMQMRQGIAVAFAISVVAWMYARNPSSLRVLPAAALAAMMHVVSVLPIAVAAALRWIPLRSTRLWMLFGVVATFGMARLAMQLDAIALVERLSLYAADDEFSGARDIFAIANIRAALLFMLLLLAAPAFVHRVHRLLLVMFAMSLGVRLGFYDFAILSGRLSTSLGFVEIFVLPLAVRCLPGGSVMHALIAVLYMLVHLIATFGVQVPYLLDDYFTPLYDHYAAG